MAIRRRRFRTLVAAAVAAVVPAAASCGDSPARPLPGHLVSIPGDSYSLGSDSLERELGYSLSPPFVRRAGWYDAWEALPYRSQVRSFALDRFPITQSDYAGFVAATGHVRPHIEESDYQSQGFLAHSYDEVRRFLWDEGSPPAASADHPVVLVNRDDARAYCAWRGDREGLELRLPTEEEWEAACRGIDSRLFPWGDEWRDGAAQMRATSTASVTAHPAGATPEGVMDLAGNVFEWTSSTMPDGRRALKGCSWDDDPGTCRCAFRHGRPATSKHILIGFRCAVSR